MPLIPINYMLTEAHDKIHDLNWANLKVSEMGLEVKKNVRGQTKHGLRDSNVKT